MRPEAITYYLPGGAQATYCGKRRSRLRWVWDTRIGAFGLWRLWLRIAWAEIAARRVPYPKHISFFMIEVLKRFHVTQGSDK